MGFDRQRFDYEMDAYLGEWAGGYDIDAMRDYFRDRWPDAASIDDIDQDDFIDMLQRFEVHEGK